MRRMSYLKLIGGLLLSVAVIIIVLARLTLEVLGASTAPDDFALLKQRMPKVLEWLYTTPWPVPTVLLVLAAAVAAWLLWSGTKKTVSDEMADQGNLTEANIKRFIAEEIDSRSSDSDALIPRFDETHIQNAINEALDAIQLNEFKIATALALKQISDNLAEVKADNSDVAKIMNAGNAAGFKALAEQVDKLKVFAEETRRNLNERFDWVSQGFAAVGIWDWHMRKFPEILEMGENLSKLVDLPVTDELWEDWHKTEKQWRNDVQFWVQFVTYYAPNIESIINEVPDSVYYGDWQFDESALGKADRVRRYKELVIAVMNLKAGREYVERAIRGAAFEGVGKKGRLEDPPSLDVTH